MALGFGRWRLGLICLGLCPGLQVFAGLQGNYVERPEKWGTGPALGTVCLELNPEPQRGSKLGGYFDLKQQYCNSTESEKTLCLSCLNNLSLLTFITCFKANAAALKSHPILIRGCRFPQPLKQGPIH